MTQAPRPGEENGVLDVDQHIFEPRTAWVDHIDPAQRDEALRIDDDDRGWPWLTWRGRRLYPVEVQHPGRPEEVGHNRLAMRTGQQAPGRYEDLLPPEYGHAAARADALEALGVERCVLFPNFGLLYEDILAGSLPALCANLRAYNRWVGEEVAGLDGRVFGVGHLSLRHGPWVVEEVATLAAAGIRLAMVAPSPVDGRPLSHDSLTPVWAAMEDHGVAPVFHVGNFRPPLDPAWYSADPEPVDRLMDSVMLGVAPAVALADLIIHGTLERFPNLRVGVVELTAGWVPRFLLQLDGACDFYAARHGGALRSLPLRPSEYFRRQVRVAALPYEDPAGLIAQVGPGILMYGSDWPHAEGVAAPGGRARGVRIPDPGAHAAYVEGNAAWLLGTA